MSGQIIEHPNVRNSFELIDGVLVESFISTYMLWLHANLYIPHVRRI